jgi:hypothetical protein
MRRSAKEDGGPKNEEGRAEGDGRWVTERAKKAKVFEEKKKGGKGGEYEGWKLI